MTIEERAKDMEYTIEGGYVPNGCLANYFKEELEKQRKADIDKACEWLRNYIISSEWNEFAEIHFRKAMIKDE